MYQTTLSCSFIKCQLTTLTSESNADKSERTELNTNNLPFLLLLSTYKIQTFPHFHSPCNAYDRYLTY